MISYPKAYINTDNLIHNIKVIKKQSSNGEILAMVKANSYGHNSDIILKALKEHVIGFGFANLNESLSNVDLIKSSELSDKIVIMAGFNSLEELIKISELSYIPVIHNMHQINLINIAYTQKHLNKKIKVWLKIDTGMGRYGFNLSEVDNAVQYLDKYTEIVTVMTHMAHSNVVSSPKNKEQITTFENALSLNCLQTKLNLSKSMANSAAILTNELTHYDIVRPGLIMYGISPFANIDASVFNLKPVMQLVAEVIVVKTIAANQTVGYGEKYLTTRKTKVALLAIGYADGYPKNADDTIVIIKGKKAKIIGAVSMDVIAIDITDIDNVMPGNQAIMWGTNDNPIEHVSMQSGVSVYEIVTGIGSRVQHIAVNNKTINTLNNKVIQDVSLV